MNITEAELLDELRAANVRGTGPKDARTGPELRALLGLGDHPFRRFLHSLRAQGRLVVHRVAREDVAGRPTTVPAYTIKPASKRKR